MPFVEVNHPVEHKSFTFITINLKIGISVHLPKSPLISQMGIGWTLNIGELVVSEM